MMQATQFEGAIQMLEFYKNVSVTIPSTATGVAGVVSITLPAGSQAASGDLVQVGAPSAWAGFLINAYVSAAGTLQLQFHNVTGGTLNVGAQNVNFIVERLSATGF